MRWVSAAAAGFAAWLALFLPAQADVVIRVAKSRQLMFVYVDGDLAYVWPVSTARDGYSTPTGIYQPTGLDPFHRSRRYHGSPMPYSIFFHGGYAIHGSYDIDSLGRPASHGCIRLDPDAAAELFFLVRRSDQTWIVVMP